MTYDEKNCLKEIYIKAVVKNERAKDDFVKAREQHKVVGDVKHIKTRPVD